ncbi:MAG: ATP-binding cassette domain-containing protein [Saccharofermentans sp.]|nr:ATP-binding cassette domain-containing protein [Saccharofermentans sp.]
MAEVLYKANDICKKYGSKTVLQNVNITIHKGDIYGLVGKNGAGKTTLMRIMTGLQSPSSGTIEYGFDRNKLGAVGALVELPSIYANMSAYENLKLQYINIGRPVDDSINEILRMVGLDNTGKLHAGKFSLGMRQRMGIAMAMAGNPEILILDEPINGLDPQGIIGVRDLLIKLNHEMGITIVISSHILSELSKLATSFAFIDKGQIVKEASSEEIEHAGKKRFEVICSSPVELSNYLVTKGYDARIDRNTNQILVFGEVNIVDLAVSCKESGFEVADIKHVDTDLEKFFIELVGGTTHA